MSKTYNVAIAGATGAVGFELIKILEQRNFPVNEIRLLASSRSAGKKMTFKGQEVTIQELTHDAFTDIDIAIFSAGGDISLKYAPSAVKAGAVVIDNSSAYRMDDNVPLVVPEVNPEAVKLHQGIIANPNCTTAIAAVALWPIHQAFGLKKVIVSTYQAASGAGAPGMNELIDGIKAGIEGKEIKNNIFSHPLPYNVIPHIDTFQENGYTKEEMKVTWETQKIFNAPELLLSCTAVRIPTLRAHSESIVVETEKPVSVEVARQLLAEAPGVKVVDDPANNVYPMPMNAAEKWDVEVGRIRQNIIFGDHGLEFFISGDQLLKGAALNAVQIAELL
ncbi:MAG: aspartate-semialdehyde dehydrogenase [Lentisphaeria bacterium]|nr:aspartate-semialdehyde dehydrogenase [Lentisphaeria bacterium]